MIRDRLERDLAPLCSVLAELSWPSSASDDSTRRAWLLQVEAEQSWVFDAAPVTVTPTRNVQGQVQVFAPGECEQPLVAASGMDPEDLLVVGRLFVRPGRHSEGIRRFLLTEAVRRVDALGRSAVLDVAANPGLTQILCRKRGFEHLTATVVGLRPMIHRERTEVSTR